MKRGGKFLAGAVMAALVGCTGEKGKLEIRSTAVPPSAVAKPVPLRIAEARGQLALGNVALALESFRKASREDPGSTDALVGMATCYDRMGRYDLSRRNYEAALALAPADTRLLAAFAASLELQGLNDEALEVRREASARAAPVIAPAALPAPPRQAAAAAPVAPVPVPAETVAVAQPPRLAMAAPVVAAPRAVATRAAPAAKIGAPPTAAVAPAPTAAAAPVAPAPPMVKAVAEPSRPVAVAILPAAKPVAAVPARAPAAAVARVAPAVTVAQAAPAVGPSVTVKLPPPRPAPARPAMPEAEPVKPAPAAPPAPAEAAPMLHAQRDTSVGPRLERLSMGEIALVTTPAPVWRPALAARTARSATVRFVPLRQASLQPVKVRLLNAARVNRLAARTRSWLVARGWRGMAIGDAPVTRAHSLVLYPRGKRALAQRLSAQFGFAIAERASGSHVTVLLGRDAARMRVLKPASA